MRLILTNVFYVILLIIITLTTVLILGTPKLLERKRQYSEYSSYSDHKESGHKDILQDENKQATPEYTDNNNYDTFPVPQPSNYSADLRLIVYNVIPKCGSTAVRQMLSTICKDNHIASVRLNTTNRPDFVQALNNIGRNKSKPLLYSFHHIYVDFHEFGAAAPPHIQIMRDPVDHGVSAYQYHRDLGKVADDEWSRSIQECMNNLTMCPWLDNILNSTMLHHFCGTQCTVAGVPAASLVCRRSKEGAVQAAKRNIVRHHSVVGVTEEIPGFLQTLEYMHPSYFNGLTQLYMESQQRNTPIVNPSRNRKDWPESVKELFRNKRWQDIEVYKFVRKRFYEHWEQAKKVMLKV